MRAFCLFVVRLLLFLSGWLNWSVMSFCRSSIAFLLLFLDSRRRSGNGRKASSRLNLAARRKKRWSNCYCKTCQSCAMKYVEKDDDDDDDDDNNEKEEENDEEEGRGSWWWRARSGEQLLFQDLSTLRDEVCDEQFLSDLFIVLPRNSFSSMFLLIFFFLCLLLFILFLFIIFLPSFMRFSLAWSSLLFSASISSQRSSHHGRVWEQRKQAEYCTDDCFSGTTRCFESSNRWWIWGSNLAAFSSQRSLSCSQRLCCK